MSASGSGAALLEPLKRRVEGESDPERRTQAMILALADLIRATSNDQNVQRLSRVLRDEAVTLGSLVMPSGVSN